MIHILYVDDEPALLDIAKTFLEQRGEFSVDTAESAGNALVQHRATHYDAIVSDYQMPGMDGIQFLKRIRKDGSTIPFIIFTGRGREEIVIQALNEGADFYLQKGGDPAAQFAELAHKIRLAVRERTAVSALERSEERYRAVVEDQTELICRFTPDGKLTFVNDAYCRYFGLERGRCLGKHHPVRVPKEDAARLKRHLASLTPDQPVGFIEHRILMPDGTVRWQRWNDRALFDRDGRLTGYQSVGRDNTELKQAEEALRESEEKYRTVFEMAADGIVVHDAEGRIIDANARACGMLGYGRDELLAMRASDLIPPEERRKNPPRISHALTGRPVYYERKLRRNDGTLLDVEIRASRFADGRVQAIWRDITDRKRAEDALREEQEFTRLLLDASPVFYVAIGNDGTTITMNRALLDALGWTQEEVAGTDYLATFVPEEDRGDLKRVFTEITRHGNAMVHENRILSRTGKVYLVEWHGTPVVRGSGKQDFFVGVGIDITDRRRAQDALRESELLLREVFDNANDGVFLLERDPESPGRYILVNKKAVEMLGYSREELLQMSPRDIVPEEIQKKVVPGVIRKLKAEGHATFESAHRRKDGTVYPVEVSTHTFRYKGKDVDLSICRDISGRARAEADLKKSEERLQLTFAATRDGIFDWDIRSGRSVFSPSYYTTLGYEPYEFPETNEAFRELVHPDDLPRVKTALGHALARSDAGYAIELRMRTKAGGWKWIQIRGRVVERDPDGTPRRMVGTHTDISERKQVEEALKESEEKFRALVETTGDFIWEVDADGVYTYVSPQVRHILGYAPGDLLGKTPFSIMPPDEAGRVAAEFERCVAARLPIPSLENKAVRKDGSVVTLETSGVPRVAADGTFLGYRGIDRDITRRKQADEALQAAHRKLNLLSSITRHDINNQLTILKSYIALLGMGNPDPATDEKYRKISTAAQRISAMIRFTKEYENIGVHAPVWQDCRILVETTLQEVLTGDIKVQNDIPAGMEVFADPLILKVCYTLVENAIRHGATITTLRFSHREAGGGCTILCEDDGIGVAAGEKERIFERGYGKNTGLGLFLAREILAITGITIAETGEPGKGARFEIAVPDGAYRFTNAP